MCPWDFPIDNGHKAKHKGLWQTTGPWRPACTGAAHVFQAGRGWNKPCSIYRYRISIVDISTLLKNINIDIEKEILENIDIDIDIDKDILENIDIDIDIDKNI